MAASAKRVALGVSYLYSVILLALAIAAGAIGFGARLGLFPEGSLYSAPVLDQEPYMGFEVATFGLLALLAFRAVSRTRRGKDTWTMRVYWPGVLAVFAVLTAAAFAFSLPGRGCEVGAGYAGYWCWDPSVTFLRVTIATAVTALFTHSVARFGAEPRTLTPKAPKGPEGLPPEGPSEEIGSYR